MKQPSFNMVKNVLNNCSSVLFVNKNNDNLFCKYYQLRKSHKLSLNHKHVRVSTPFALMFLNLWTYLTFLVLEINIYYYYWWIFLIAKRLYAQVKIIQIDGRCEFKPLISILKKDEVVCRCNCTHTSEQNKELSACT